MAQTKNSMSKLDRLTMLRDTLLDCCKESVKDADDVVLLALVGVLNLKLYHSSYNSNTMMFPFMLGSCPNKRSV